MFEITLLSFLSKLDACSGTGPNDIFQQSPAGSIANVIDSTLHNLTDKRILVQVAEYYLVSFLMQHNNVHVFRVYLNFLKAQESQ